MGGLKVLLADDEPLARLRLGRLLREAGCEVVAEFGDGEDLLAWLRRGGAVDAMFLDIQMPEATGLDVVAELEAPPPTVFVTTYSEHAVKAFEAAAVDYLLKPVSKARLDRTLERLRAARAPGPERSAPEGNRVARIPVRAGAGVILLDPRKASHFEVEEKVVYAWCGRERLETTWNALSEAEQLLPVAGLLRIQRHLLLRLEAVVGVRSLGGGRLQVRLAEGLDLDVSRTASPRLRELLGLGNLGVADAP